MVNINNEAAIRFRRHVADREAHIRPRRICGARVYPDKTLSGMIVFVVPKVPVTSSLHFYDTDTSRPHPAVR